MLNPWTRTIMVVGGLFLQALAAAQITVDHLLDEMTDLTRLTRMPDPDYLTRQFSSYDRASLSPSRDWFANSDAGHYLREEKKDGHTEYVMMEADGPGVVVRIWSANPGGTLRIYLDHQETPVIQENMKKLLGGEVPAFPEPLSGVRALGYNLYFPIPFARHCKITSDGGGAYYHVGYRAYADGTAVKSLTTDGLTRLADKIRATADKLAAPRKVGAVPEGSAKTVFDLTLAPATIQLIAEPSGSAMIRELTARLSAEDLDQAARQVVLYMDFDGRRTVECPLGDFFGTAPGLNPYESLPLGITSGSNPEMWCHWPMPFANRAKITVRNFGAQPVRLTGSLAFTPCEWDKERSLYFHAKWRIERHLPASPRSDWTHLATSGSGRFVGGALHIQNDNRHWWGEGDEKIYLGEEIFPSTFGTGTEDYYGYAWCCTDLFTHAYHNQTCSGRPDYYGDISLNRFHILDDMPYKLLFRFDMENWHHRPYASTTRAAVSYWYTQAGSDFFAPLTAEDLHFTRMPPYEIYRVPGVIEGESMELLNKPAGEIRRQIVDKPWSNEGQLWWDAKAPGDKLVLGFEAAEAGSRQVRIRLTRYPDYAQVRMSVNGQAATCGVLDLYAPTVELTEDMDLGRFELTKGQNTLEIEIVGANPHAAKNYVFGLDYLRIES